MRGSHHFLERQESAEKINLQRDDGKAKMYQVKQVRNLIVNYNLKSRP